MNNICDKVLMLKRSKCLLNGDNKFVAAGTEFAPVKYFSNNLFSGSQVSQLLTISIKWDPKNQIQHWCFLLMVKR